MGNSRCKIHGTPLKQGGCFQNIYTWCPKCEDADTEPMTDPGFKTPPLQRLKLGDWTGEVRIITKWFTPK